MQVHDYKLINHIDQQGDGNHSNHDKYNLIAYFYRLGEFQATVDGLFEFARNRGEFNSTPLDWEGFRNAHLSPDILVDEIHIDDKMN